MNAVQGLRSMGGHAGLSPYFFHMDTTVHFSAQTCVWPTPDSLFDKLDAEFGFTLDVCCLPENAKCTKYFTPDDDGLLQNWYGKVWCNPPYGNRIGDWVEKAFREAHNGVTTVMLLPVRTDTRWFHSWVIGKAEIRFLKGRLKFGNAENSAPFPSMVIIYNRR